MTKTIITKRASLDSDSVALDTPFQPVDHTLVRATGIALPDPQGVENEATVASVRRELTEEQFMAEKVEIVLGAPQNDSDHLFCEITVNGEYLCLRRDGETSYPVKRSHLGVLAGAKVQRLVQKKITLPDGSLGYQEQAQLQPLYPFQVIHEPNPRGVTWLRQMLQRS